MNAFAESNIACAERNIARALERLEAFINDAPEPRLLGEAHLELMLAKGRLAAAAQLEELEREIAGVADTERPSHLRVVR